MLKKVIQKKVDEFGTGSWKFISDDTHAKHEISDFAMKRIIKEIENT